MSNQEMDRLLLYYRTMEQMKAYREVPVEEKFAWLQMQMEFYHECMSDKAKRFSERLNSGKSS